ncbi:lytic transglycosylase domain-containing protein [Ralstonia sp. CHL-2022]|uniref:Lytic transglycosylase domain-containing protein n=1 Tax=Ralstonia mojiangensis TaxID=2953895 RepID=A0ABT2LA99_9RALS|nr:lytic transglycosylase domain-containing protein [Ralstonia mojiangensis]MCT7311989.1 lytic transglycosylase domain-containing protein [Ralstonia mojiangensis]
MRGRDRYAAALRRALVFAIALLGCLPAAALADCIDDAAAYHGVNAQVLRAIGYQESHLNPQAHNRNRNGSEDLGMFQINTIHLPELSRYGIGRQMLYDPCVSAYVAAWHLARKVQLHGNSWHAIGAYHSESPGENGIYARAVEGILTRKLAARAPLPVAGQARAQEPAPQPMQDGAKPMRPVVLKHTADQASERKTQALNVPPGGADEHWLDAMLTSLNQSASLRDRFSR